MTTTTTTTTKAKATEAKAEAPALSIMEQADIAMAAGGLPALETLSMLLAKAEGADRTYVIGLAAEAEAGESSRSMVFRLFAGRTIGNGVLAEVRSRFNTGRVTKADGTKADALASDAKVSDASVRLALGLNAEGARFMVAPDRSVGRSDVQRFCDLARVDETDVRKGWADSLAAGTERDYTKTVQAVRDAHLWRTDATAAAKRETDRAEREQLRKESAEHAKAKAKAEAEETKAAEAVPSPVTMDPAWSGRQLRAIIREANAALTSVAKREAEAKAKAEAADAAFATMAEASGMTIEELRDVLAAAAATKAPAA